MSSPLKTRKRAFDEIADSDGEDVSSEYGWLDEDGVAAEGLVDEEVVADEAATDPGP